MHTFSSGLHHTGATFQFQCLDEDSCTAAAEADVVFQRINVLHTWCRLINVPKVLTTLNPNRHSGQAILILGF